MARPSRRTSAMARLERSAAGRAAQERGVARLQADAGGVAGDVGAVLVDDRHHAERAPGTRSICSPLGRRQPSSTSPTGSGSAATSRRPSAMPVDAGVGEAQPVERAGFHAVGLRPASTSTPVGGEQVAGALVEEVGGGEQGGVLRRRSSADASARRRGPGPPARARATAVGRTCAASVRPEPPIGRPAGLRRRTGQPGIREG